MAELREDSLLFSLETLMVRERERVQLDRAEAERQRAEEARAAVAREKQRLEAELARERKLELARVAEQARLAEHATKLEALRQAEVVRAQTEANARAQSEMLAQRHAHERNLAELALGAKRSRDRAIAIGSSALLSLFVPAALLFHFSHTLPAAKRTESELRRLVLLEQSRAEEASKQLSQVEARGQRLSEEVARLRVASPPEAAPPAPSGAAPSGPPRRVPQARPRTPQRNTPCRDSGDPLDPCLH